MEIHSKYANKYFIKSALLNFSLYMRIPVTSLAYFNERYRFCRKFTTKFVISRAVFTLLQKKGASNSLHFKSCKITKKI